MCADTLPRRGGRWVGRPVERVEDARLLLGCGSFLADLRLPGALQAVFVRSPIAHGLIRSIEAVQVPGATVLTGHDLPHEALTDLLPIEGLLKTPQPALAPERVRFVGEPIALVLAEDRYLAEDAAEVVAVEYEPLPFVLDAEEALLDGAPMLFPDLGSNVVYRATRSSATSMAPSRAPTTSSARGTTATATQRYPWRRAAVPRASMRPGVS